MSNQNSFPPEPSPLSSTAVPSSFDNEFFEESRFQKLSRKIRQEPLIPVGCAATCYALYMATKSIRAGDHHQTNRMFRARIYAQGFTLLALVAGSFFYKDERLKRKVFEQALEEKKSAEKREKWLRELEARDQEDREWRERIERASQDARAGVQDVKQAAKSLIEEGKENLNKVEQQFEPGPPEQKKSSWPSWNRSVKDEVASQGWGPGMWVSRTGDAWRRF
ncbi:Respiratory supercomplex factor 1, mitochondrial [Exophiala xenobiotica]|uniref:Respiratory supercomplex factor 1, mitochondrial n=1 Tax=Vermiconidia calcicola TaxID=1690605 RepID=A0AAV9QAX0_9PEZI|nr:Respiratory supercomplex factor 1, mitochondrial [Exophiala xenobiotica]KAK5533183.1 Respiratory supercomplex factor 1, mitochondrial [Chaetothyriales sp. CCFEE 6169]KAK5536806.1 Respiratory supercomplex factor 1, mitochondrial [Vermiconidia calcicola]KAK5365822.1 Respiratory supercomplex factor 1, mitochondrial [Exophiala xenobiotica]KAK5392346.1 Respiratory supercomplex factor 1, mitochondrial [Exophiala xenobiotica]